jgi:hypothetical protein
MSGGDGVFAEMQIWRVTAVANFLLTEIALKLRPLSLLVF